MRKGGSSLLRGEGGRVRSELSLEVYPEAGIPAVRI